MKRLRAATAQANPHIERMTTYKLESIAGEYGWVAHPDYFDDDDEPNDIIEEVWQRVSVRKFQYPAPKTPQ